MSRLSSAQNPPCQYSDGLENAIEAVVSRLRGEYRLAYRSIALLLLQGDEGIVDLVRDGEGKDFEEVEASVLRARGLEEGDLDTAIAVQRRDAVRLITAVATSRPSRIGIPFTERLSRLCMSPITGVPILALVLWFGLYQFVGVFGGKTLVDMLETGLFGKILNPWMIHHVQRLLPWPWISDLFVGPYGVW